MVMREFLLVLDAAIHFSVAVRGCPTAAGQHLVVTCYSHHPPYHCLVQAHHQDIMRHMTSETQVPSS